LKVLFDLLLDCSFAYYDFPLKECSVPVVSLGFLPKKNNGQLPLQKRRLVLAVCAPFFSNA
jgi:hypothetical protein